MMSENDDLKLTMNAWFVSFVERMTSGEQIEPFYITPISTDDLCKESIYPLLPGVF
jgi:hypothetical protein